MPKSKKPLVIVTRKLPERVETRMRELFEARLNETDQPMSQAQLAEALGLDRVDSVMLALTLVVSMLTFASGRTNVLQGAVHMMLFLAYAGSNSGSALADALSSPTGPRLLAVGAVVTTITAAVAIIGGRVLAGEPIQFETQLLHRDGTARELELRGRPD